MRVRQPPGLPIWARIGFWQFVAGLVLAALALWAWWTAEPGPAEPPPAAAVTE